MTLVLDGNGKGTLTFQKSAVAVAQYSSNNSKGNPVYVLTLMDQSGNTTGGGTLTYGIDPNSSAYGILMLTSSDMNVIFQKSGS